ncbi:MAG: hypothetical protein JW976_00825 [Syntrophaceae bacterium]|nr:hypothetical protein [Syntrophaceae bacterium]
MKNLINRLVNDYSQQRKDLLKQCEERNELDILEKMKECFTLADELSEIIKREALITGNKQLIGMLNLLLITLYCAPDPILTKKVEEELISLFEREAACPAYLQ